CGGFCGNPFKQIEITAGPQASSLLDGTVAEKAEHDLFRSGKPYDLCEGVRFTARIFWCIIRRLYSGPVFLFSPEWKAENQECCQYDLKHADIEVTGIPCLSSGKCKSHDVRSESCANTPHTVEPAHVMAFIVQRYIVIQSCIHAAGAQPVWDSP